ncbi:hypothetical protein [Dyadobacter helix]|nr:hypothetical protein [Dyadobacter sp. CECT 9275]
MKNFLIILTFTSFLFSCKKDKDAAPELSARVAGTYQASRMTADGQALPLGNGTELQIILTKASAETVNGTMKLKLGGNPEPDESLGLLILKDAGDSGTDIFTGTDKVGTVSKSGSLTVTVEDDGVEYKIYADKK